MIFFDDSANIQKKNQQDKILFINNVKCTIFYLKGMRALRAVNETS